MSHDDAADQVAAASGEEDRRAHFVREVITIAIYLALSLLAVLVAVPKSVLSEDSHSNAALQVAGTGVALLLAHHLALRLSSRMIDKGVLDHESLQALKAQLVGGVPVILLASLPVAIWGRVPGAVIAMYALVGLVAVVGYIIARRAGLDGVRAFMYVGVVVLALALVVGIKVAVGH